MKKNLILKKTPTGLGLFTTTPIKKGAKVIEYTGEIISREVADRRGGRYLFTLNKNKFIDGKGRENLGRYANHSCKPNCSPLMNNAETRVFIHAKRAIQPGEEITYNYGKEYTSEYCTPCKCAYCLSKN